jgi:hypothetical protein
MPRRRAILVLLGVVALALAFFQVSFPATEGQKASRDIAKSATLVYISLRAVNAALSVSQEIEIGASAVASATAQPLKVLDPVDDTIERIAAVVFAIAAASWILSVAFQPIAAIGFSVMGVGLIAMAASDRWPDMKRSAGAAVRFGLAFAVLLPLVYAGGAMIGRAATEGIQAEASATLDGVATEARKLIGRDDGQTPETVEEGPGWFTGFWDRAGQVGDQVSRFTNAADYYWANADTVLEAAFVLIAVFVLRVLVMPLLLIVLLWRLLGGTL